jgi:hypothetical protein
MISHSGEDGNGTIWCITYQAATTAVDRGLNPSGDWPLFVRLYRALRSDNEVVSLGPAPLRPVAASVLDMVLRALPDRRRAAPIPPPDATFENPIT